MIIKVALNVAPNYILDYKADDNIKLFQRVAVKVGKRNLIGFVIEKNISVDYDEAKVKNIDVILDNGEELISPNIIQLIEWTAKYYHADIYNTIKLALPNEYFKSEIVSPKEDIVYTLCDKLPEKITPKQQLIIEYLQKHSLLRKNELKGLGFSTNIIKTLVDKEAIHKSTQITTLKKSSSNDDTRKDLSYEQKNVLESIVESKGFETFLLYGVTGSGKTEIYLQAIEKCLNKQQQVLVLIPEINLTPQTISRFESRFSNSRIVSMHSRLTEKEKLTNWHHIKNGSTDIMIATRSGVLADFKNLGMIIVDEEHDSSFKQQTSTIRYHARDLAILRAKFLDIPIILGSATPSIESYYNALNGKYTLLKLRNRVSKHQPAEIRLLDLKTSVSKNGISSALLNMLENNILNHSQSLIFVNKLGYAKALVCKSCGEACECEKCDKPYTLHNYPNQHLECHFCGTKKQISIQCSICGSNELFTYGTGTERVEGYLTEKFPNNDILRFDRQNIKNNSQLDNAIEAIAKNNIDIIIGTQMISKGHHFENITLVGLINIDSGFYSTDFHATEKTAQLIVQVAGRAGRGDKQGLVILQTFQPETPILQKLINYDYLKFLDYLLEQRKYTNYPPYSFQAQILAESRNEQNVLELLNHIYTATHKIANIQLSKPLPAVHLKRNNIYRYSLLLTANSRMNLAKTLNYIRRFLDINEISNQIKVYFDVDPIEF